MRQLARRHFLLGAVLDTDPGQTTFEFLSSFWVNLHHTLFNQADGLRAGRRPDASAPEWDEALAYYGREFGGRDIAQVSLRLNRDLARGVKIPLLLRQVAPFYREHWWPLHDQKNREWIETAGPMIATYERAARAALSHAYDTPWPRAGCASR